MHPGVDPELVVAAPDVPNERVTPDDHARGPIAFEATHRAEPGLEAAVVGLDPVVRIPASVMTRAGHELIDNRQQSPSPVGDHLARRAVSTKRRREESPR